MMKQIKEEKKEREREKEGNNKRYTINVLIL